MITKFKIFESEQQGKTLLLTLSRQPFDVMITGEKTDEFRRGGGWIYSRLLNKNGSPKKYDYVKFTNGYGNHRPYFICEYRGFYILKEDEYHRRVYSNGLTVEPMKKGDVIIHLGKIIERNL